MNEKFAAALRRAVGLTRASDVIGATRVLQNALAGRKDSGAEGGEPARRSARQAEILPPALPRPAASGAAEAAEAKPDPSPRSFAPRPSPRPRRPLGDVLNLLREVRGRIPSPSVLPGMPGGRAEAPPVPDGAEFALRNFSGAAGARAYWLYVPASARETPRGLVVMLHGCKQNSQDFSAGTGMNAVAERHGLIVAWPEQTSAANPNACWNWFDPAHQERASGEPAIIAGITRALVAEFGIDPEKIFVAGLSAGGAMAAVMGETFPDLYAAVGIHSGLAYRSASDVVSAFAAMRGGASSPSAPRRTADGARVRRIVFQGSADAVVHPSNAEKIVAAADAAGLARREVRGVAGGRAFTRMVLRSAGGAALIESWTIEGAGHAWSGGDPRGSFTDAQGPDATAEMVRFFLDDASAA